MIARAREMGGRICPNCMNLVIKEEGCNRITCSCGKSWCYACPLGHAFVADTKDEVYAHLNEKHGGYWGQPMD